MPQGDVISFNTYYYGTNFEIDVLGYRFFQTTIQDRKSLLREDSFQITQSWPRPFSLGEQHWTYDGFIDWTNTTSDTRASLNFTSQLKWDLGNAWYGKSKELYFGMEYVLWRNKFGIRNTPVFDTNENNANLLIKFHF